MDDLDMLLYNQILIMKALAGLAKAPLNGLLDGAVDQTMTRQSLNGRPVPAVHWSMQ